jgi:GDP-L-fucose synthase
MKSKILVTGGSGMVGQSLKKILPQAKFVSSKDCDFSKRGDTIDFFNDIKPDIVIHAAARVGGIVANMSSPVEFFEDNIYINTNVCSASYKSGVKKFIGVLSTCIYPDNVENTLYPMKENLLFEGPPPKQNFSYAYAKRSLAVQIESYRNQYDMSDWCYIIPCNLYGENDKFDFQRSHFVSALIDKLHNAQNNSIELLGTGKPLRQFMHSDDLARAIKEMVLGNIFKDFNIATDEVLSVDQITNLAIKCLNFDDINVNYSGNKIEDGNFRKDVSSDRFLSNFPDFNFTRLSDGMRAVYNIYKEEKK